MIMVKVNSNCDGNWRGSYWPWWLSSGLPSGNCYGGARTGKWAFCLETNSHWTNCPEKNLFGQIFFGQTVFRQVVFGQIICGN